MKNKMSDALMQCYYYYLSKEKIGVGSFWADPREIAAVNKDKYFDFKFLNSKTGKYEHIK